MTKKEQWISAVQDDLLAFLRRRSPNNAQELAQETWLRMTQANPSLATQSEHRRYLFTTARRTLIDHYRTTRVRPTLIADGTDDHLRLVSQHATPDQELAATNTTKIIQDALATMNPDIAEVFVLRMTTPTTFKRIAAQQGVPLNTALGRMHLATKTVRAALTAAGHTLSETQ